MQLILEIHTPRIQPGGIVRLVEWVPTGGGGDRVGQIGHDVTRVARFDPVSRAFVAIPDQHRSPSDVASEFDGLPESLWGHPGIPLSLRAADRVGMEFDVRGRRLGVYTITASWQFSKGQVLRSAPVGLIVGPPHGADGHMSIEPAWLDES